MSRRRTGKDHYKWNGGRYVVKDKYIALKLPDGRRVYEHRHVMALHLGRDLLRNEIVHHINGDKHDNRIENLELMSNSEHTKKHWEENVFGERSELAKRFQMKKTMKKVLTQKQKEKKDKLKKQKKLERDRKRYWSKKVEISRNKSIWYKEDKLAQGVYQKRAEAFAAKAQSKGMTPEEYRAILDKKAEYQRNWKKSKST